MSFYDGLGNRVEKSGPSVGGWSDYLYDGGQVAARWTNQVVDHSCVYLGGKLVADYSGPSGALAVNYAHLDQLGSTRPLIAVIRHPCRETVGGRPNPEPILERRTKRGIARYFSQFLTGA